MPAQGSLARESCRRTSRVHAAWHVLGRELSACYGIPLVRGFSSGPRESAQDFLSREQGAGPEGMGQGPAARGKLSAVGLGEIPKKASLSEHTTHPWNWRGGTRGEWDGEGSRHTAPAWNGSSDLPALLAVPGLRGLRAGTKAREPRCSALSTRGCGDTKGRSPLGSRPGPAPAPRPLRALGKRCCAGFAFA